MSGRHRPPLTERLGSQLADAVLRNKPAEARDLARKLLEREAAERRHREDERSGRA